MRRRLHPEVAALQQRRRVGVAHRASVGAALFAHYLYSTLTPHQAPIYDAVMQKESDSKNKKKPSDPKTEQIKGYIHPR
jgi:hypothetical protein